MARGLCAEVVLLHQLDQRALAVAGRRLGLAGVDLLVHHIHQVTLVEKRQFEVLLAAVWVVLQPSGRHHPVAASHEGLAADGHVHPVGLHDGVIGKGGHEAAYNQLVEAPLPVAQFAPPGAARGIDGRMVGGAFVAAAGVQRGPRLRSFTDFTGELAVGEHLQSLPHIQRGRIDRIVGAWVADVPGHVQVLGDTHDAAAL